MLMPSSRAGLLSLGLLTAVATAGLAWHECVLAGATLVLAHRLFLWQTDLGAPWDGFRLGVRCAGAGLLGLLTTVVLGGVAVAGLSNLLSMVHSNAAPAVLVLSIAAACTVAVQCSAARRITELWFAGTWLMAAVLALAAAEAGWTAMPCSLTLSMAVYLARVNWRLVRAGFEAFLPCGPR